MGNWWWKPGKEGIPCVGRLAGGMNDWAMLMAMEMTLAKENRGCVCGGHMLGCCGTGGDRVTLSLLPGLGVSF